MKNPFRKDYEISLNRVHDTVRISENGEILTLTVNADPMRLVAALSKAQKALTESVNKDDPDDGEILNAAELFATAIFGPEQAKKLFEFYTGDSSCVINVCGQYFRDRLGKKIADQQKKMKP